MTIANESHSMPGTETFARDACGYPFGIDRVALIECLRVLADKLERADTDLALIVQSVAISSVAKHDDYLATELTLKFTESLK